jgi:CelD/BcsL family acetyltransferase involved in cellulose biosynthesis
MLREAWFALHQQCSSVLFCSPDWLLLWIEHYWQSEWQLELWLYVDSGKLVALLPCYSQPAEKAPYRVLYPLGQGEPECSEVASEFVDLLIASSQKSVLIKELAYRMGKSGFQRLIWRAVASDANVIELARHLRGGILQTCGIRYEAAAHKAIDLSTQVKRKWLKILQQQEVGQAKFCWLNTQQVIKMWPKLKALHQTRWQKKGKPGAFCSTVFNNFHLQFIDKHPDLFRMSMLELDGEVAALHYYLKSGDVLHFYQAGWAEEFARWSPSTMLHLWSIQQSDSLYYDFMLGGANSYKTEFSTKKSVCYQLDVYKSFGAYLLAFMKKIKNNRMLR